jgi:hypothetical protein
MIVSLLLERDISKTLISIYVQVLLEMTKHLTLDRTAWGCRSATEKQLAEDTAHHQKPSTDGGAAHRALILKASTDCTSTATGEESRVCSLHWRSSPCTNQLRSLTGVAALVGAWISRGYSRGSRPAAERWTNAHLGRSGLHSSVPTTQYPNATNNEHINRDRRAEGATDEHCSMEHTRHLSAGAGSAAVETPCACSSKPAKNRRPTPHERRTTNRKRGGPKFNEIWS